MTRQNIWAFLYSLKILWSPADQNPQILRLYYISGI